jgi:hypothetical protein
MQVNAEAVPLSQVQCHAVRHLCTVILPALPCVLQVAAALSRNKVEGNMTVQGRRIALQPHYPQPRLQSRPQPRLQPNP